MQLYAINRRVFHFVCVMALCIGVFSMSGAAKPTSAKPRGLATDVVTINGGGGALADGSDGIKMRFNVTGYGEQVWFTNKYFNYSGDASGDFGIHLNVGGTLYTSLNGSDSSETLSDSAKFDNLVISGLTGTASLAGGSSTGNGGVIMTYDVTSGGKVYTVKRTISYTYPNTYYTDEFDVTIPAGNTAVVKLYKGGDTAPGGTDQGVGALFRSPVTDLQSINPSSGVIYGMKEIAQETGMSTFEGAVTDDYSDHYDKVVAGTDISFYANDPRPSTFDAGLMIQYTIGDDPTTPSAEVAAAGIYHEEHYMYLGFQRVNLEAAWASTTVSNVGRLNLTLTNAFLESKSGLGFTFTVPSPLIVGTITNGCGGTVSQVGNVLTFSGITVADLASCLIAVDVGRPTAGSSSFSAGSATSLVGTGMNNNVGSSTVTFSSASSTFTPTRVPSLTPSTTLTPSNTRTPSNTLTRSPTKTLTASNTRTATETLTPSNTRTATATNTPTPIPYMMKKGAVGASFVLALLQNGTLVTWGMNREYQANISPCCGSGIDDIAVGTNFAVVVKGGRVYGWGANTVGQLNFPLMSQKDVVAVAAGYAHVLALKSNGSVLGWGENLYKQATIPKSIKGIVSVAGGAYHSLAVTNKGKVLAWGRNTNGQIKVPSSLTNVTMATGGLDHSLALKKDGTVVAWGNNDKWQSKVPTSLKDVKFISAGNKFSLALRNDGTIFGWGDNVKGQISYPDGIKDIFTVGAGYSNSIIGLRNGGIMVVGDQTSGVDASRTPTKTATPTP